MSRIFTDFVMHNYRSNQSVREPIAFVTRCGTDLRHQYGIFGGKSQTSFSRNATRAGSEEGRLFSQARCIVAEVKSLVKLCNENSFGLAAEAHIKVVGIPTKMATFSKNWSPENITTENHI